VLFQKAEQFVIEEARIGTHHANGLALLPQRQRFFEELHYSACWPAVAAAQPAVE
jgi:hypothetical protein